jgi:hypothetical protein
MTMRNIQLQGLIATHTGVVNTRLDQKWKTVSKGADNFALGPV